MTGQVEAAEEPISISAVDPKLVGIRGWLILPAIGLVVGVIASIVTLIALFVMFSRLTRYDDSTALVFILSVEVGLALFSIYAAIQFFKKKRNAPSVIVTLLLVGICASILEYVVLTQILQSSSAIQTRILEQLTLQVPKAAIWIPYFLVSKRVKATFVN
ncbi:MAG: DUF2569 domain-containing protein [Nitrospira sp.]|nr:DUF2569 domain-containing protein [Nitrospira sp.]